ncbi:MAG: hypothetical protein ABSG30_17100 [Steroidobacteraceae bacterium]
MSSEFDRDESLDRELETRLGQALRALPERRAPATLESRVLDTLAWRAPLPWWRRDFREWPAAARVAFGVTSAALIVLTVLAAAAANANLGSLGASEALSTPVLHDASVLFVIARTLSNSLTTILSSGWALGCLIASAALYAALFGLAIAGYRTLYLNADPEGRP